MIWLLPKDMDGPLDAKGSLGFIWSNLIEGLLEWRLIGGLLNNNKGGFAEIQFFLYWTSSFVKVKEL